MKPLHHAIISRIVSDAVGEGYTLDVFNGEETMLRNSRDERAILAALESTQEDQLRFKREGKRVGVVRLVYAREGFAVANEFTPILDPIMTGARKVAEGIFSR